MTALVVETGMLFAVGGIAVALELRDVALGDQIAVEVVFNFAADDLDLGEVPHSGLADIAAAAGEVLLLPADLLAGVVAQRRNDAVDGAGVLVGLELVLAGRLVVVGAAAIVKELQFAHAVVRRVHIGGRGTHAESVVAVLGHHELETENEVPVLLLRDEIAGLTLDLPLGEALEHTRLLGIDTVHPNCAFPTLEIVAVEQAHKAFVNRSGIAATLIAAIERATSGKNQSGGSGNQSFYMHFNSFFLSAHYTKSSLHTTTVRTKRCHVLRTVKR